MDFICLYPKVGDNGGKIEVYFKKNTIAKAIRHCREENIKWFPVDENKTGEVPKGYLYIAKNGIIQRLICEI